MPSPHPPPWLLPILHSTSPSLPLLRRAHALLLTSGSLPNRFLSNNLITLYSKYGSLSLARQLFDQTPTKDSITFNSLLSAFALHNQPNEALQLFRQMLQNSIPITRLTFTPILKLCSSSPELLPVSRSVHCCSICIGLDSDAMVSSALIGVYSKYGLLDNARYLFDRMDERDVVLWNVMIKGYAQMGFSGKAFSMFRELHRSEGIQPDGISARCVLMGREMGREFEQVQGFGIKSCLFDGASDVVSWNKRMSEKAKLGESGEVLDCFVQMGRMGVRYDNVSFVVVVSAVAGEQWFEVGRQVHGMAMKLGFCLEITVSNNLINMYAKMGSLGCSRRVFDKMAELDLVSWNTMISASVQNGLEKESAVLFLDMLKHGVVPDQFTLASILRACSGIAGDCSLHKQVHTLAIRMGLFADSFVLTALIDVYAKRGSMEEAELLFNDMEWFDSATFNALITGYTANNDSQKALNLFALLHGSGERCNHFTLATILKACSGLVALPEGKQVHSYAIKLGFDSDLCVSSGILDTYVKCGSIKDASAIFVDIQEPDDVAWTAMISGCTENGDEDYALTLYHQMRRSGALPDEFTLASLMKACSCLAALGQGKQIHANAIKLNHASDPFVGTSIMDMYARCGNIEDSYELFKRMEVKNIASWNAMLLGFAQHGNGKEALNLFNRLIIEGLRPDKITFVGVLSACSHSGLVSEAYGYFNSMHKDYGIEPEVEHYSCLVDVLGRAGLLSKAEEVMGTMPFDASPSLCRTLLGACRIRGNMEIGQRVATKLLALEPLDSSAYVLLSNIHASADQWDGVADARRRMKSNNVRKDPGCSWIEVKNKLHLFVVDDKSHPESDAIYNEVEDLIRRIKLEGYVPDRDFVLLDVEEEEKERSLYYHSEKLAIAYGLLVTQPPIRIRIIKNLRVCGDCHNAIKYISKITRREIVLRDASRFHCFKDGTCSCGDYW